MQRLTMERVVIRSRGPRDEFNINRTRGNSFVRFGPCKAPLAAVNETNVKYLELTHGNRGAITISCATGDESIGAARLRT